MSKKPTWELIGSAILVKEDKADMESKGGIVLPDTRRTHSFKGTVVGVGRGQLLKNGTILPPQCKVGDTVVFGARYRSDVVFDGEEYIAIPEEHILGIVR